MEKRERERETFDTRERVLQKPPFFLPSDVAVRVPGRAERVAGDGVGLGLRPTGTRCAIRSLLGALGKFSSTLRWDLWESSNALQSASPVAFHMKHSRYRSVQSP